MSEIRFLLILVVLSSSTACSAGDEGKELAKAYFAADWLNCGHSWVSKRLNTIAGSKFDYYTQITEPTIISQIYAVSDEEKINGWEFKAQYFLTCKLSRVSLTNNDGHTVTGHDVWGDWSIHDAADKQTPCGLDQGGELFITKRRGQITYYQTDNLSSGGFTAIEDRNRSMSLPSMSPKTCDELPKGYDDIPKL